MPIKGLSRQESRGLLGDPTNVEEEQRSLAALAGCDSWLECLCPEPCWCVYENRLLDSIDWEESDLGNG